MSQSAVVQNAMTYKNRQYPKHLIFWGSKMDYNVNVDLEVYMYRKL